MAVVRSTTALTYACLLPTPLLTVHFDAHLERTVHALANTMC